MICCMVESLTAPYRKTRRLQVWALDSMPVTLPITQRGNCQKFNNHAKGGGVLWSLNLDAPPDVSPIRILNIMRGQWNDAGLIQDIPLVAKGPIYLMDRGFYCQKALQTWTSTQVRFIMRAKKQYLQFAPIQELSRPRKLPGAVRVELDAIVELKWKTSMGTVQVRLIQAWLPNGEDLFLTTNLKQVSAEQILRLYRRRDRIEKFHRLLKQAIGLAHLYSFDPCGIELLIQVAALIAILLYMDSRGCLSAEDTVYAIQRALRDARRALDIQQPWKRNTHTRYRRLKKHSKTSSSDTQTNATNH